MYMDPLLPTASERPPVTPEATVCVAQAPFPRVATTIALVLPSTYATTGSPLSVMPIPVTPGCGQPPHRGSVATMLVCHFPLASRVAILTSCCAAFTA